MPRKRLEDFLAICLVWLIPRRAQCRGGSESDALQQLIRGLEQGNEIVIHDPAHSVPGTQHFIDESVLLQLKNGSNK